jgi:hypothetical protein
LLDQHIWLDYGGEVVDDSIKTTFATALNTHAGLWAANLHRGTDVAVSASSKAAICSGMMHRELSALIWVSTSDKASVGSVTMQIPIEH